MLISDECILFVVTCMQQHSIVTNKFALFRHWTACTVDDAFIVGVYLFVLSIRVCSMHDLRWRKMGR